MAGKWVEGEWFFLVRLGLKMSLVLGVVYVSYHFYERNRIANLMRNSEPKRIELPDDAYTFVPKSRVTDLESARRKLVGHPLWVKEGYRWSYEPGDRLFEPLERIVPTAVRVQNGEVKLIFDKDGRAAFFTIGTPERVFVDDIFFVKDPREIYDHWTEEMWRKVRDHVVEVGMSEFQITFALGVGRVVRQSPSTALRIVDYTACRQEGLDPIRVTYQRHLARSIEPLDP